MKCDACREACACEAIRQWEQYGVLLQEAGEDVTDFFDALPDWYVKSHRLVRVI
ncbi:hypothetical protein Psi02_59540 [Planotetraspora silvatica]|uniref:Uncharacterized protein n=1 Tax=Planotetraspora silvatica TaxID=234614 RepID=A0A8J3V421_9ACTN|nr:hypothetical protein Psi02_59540 [Planotetraspora silvatica]